MKFSSGERKEESQRSERFPSVFILEEAAPEEDIEIILCRSASEEDALIRLARRMGREIWAAESYPFAAQFPEFLEGYEQA